MCQIVVITTQGIKIRTIKYRGSQYIGFTKFRKQVMFRVKDILNIETENYLISYQNLFYLKTSFVENHDLRVAIT